VDGVVHIHIGDRGAATTRRDEPWGHGGVADTEGVIEYTADATVAAQALPVAPASSSGQARVELTLH
jgi:hypothetical protein